MAKLEKGGVIVDQFSEPERLRRQTEECCTMAELLGREEPRATYLRLAPGL
jgi:hypothetical protein